MRKLEPETRMLVGSEIRRKCLHLVGLAVPTLYWFTNQFTMLCFIAFFFVLFVAFEIYRFRRGLPPAAEAAKPVMRGYEERGVGGHVFLAGGLFIAVLAFEKNVAIAVSVVTVLGDAAAAIIGKRFGTHELVREKTVEGTLALVAVALVAAIWFVGGVAALAGALAAGIVELLPINDNFSIPVFSGLVMNTALHLL